MTTNDDGHPCSRLSGFIPEIPTPFTDDDRIDFAAFERYCDTHRRVGASAIEVCGIAGECATLTDAEHRELIAAARQVLGSRTVLIAGAGSNATDHAIALSRAAQAAGADMIVSAVPCYNKPTQAGIVAHFAAIAGSVDVPIMLHDFPARSAVGLADTTFLRLADHSRIAALKDSSGTVGRWTKLKDALDGRAIMVSGDDSTALAFLGEGGNACMSAATNMVPRLCASLFDDLSAGKLTKARASAQRFTKLTSALNQLSHPAALKFVLSELGWMRPHLRSPLMAIDAKDQESLVALLETLLADLLTPASHPRAIGPRPSSVGVPDAEAESLIPRL